MVNLSPPEERLFEYLRRRKTPVASDTVAKQFIISQSRAANLLRFLFEKGLLDVVSVGKKRFFKIKD